MAQFLDENFLLGGGTARKLYHEVAADLPIIDYHCHLSPADLAADRRFENLWEIWLQGDHYKWRAMRANGISEEFCTGEADPYEKFLAFARTVPATLRNPLYHWSHLELRRYFGIEELLNGDSAPAIWEKANAILKGKDFSVSGILRKFKVETICTTDDPVDALEHHQHLAKSDFPARVVPAFRPDPAFSVGDPEAWNAWCDRLSEASGIEVGSLAGLLEALESRHLFFHEQGCRLSDHGLNHCPVTDFSEPEARAVFDKVRADKKSATGPEVDLFTAFLLDWLGERDHARGWVKQLHLGARRNNRTRGLLSIGRDSGFDSIGDWRQVEGLSLFMDRLDQRNALPRMIIYNLNPSDNYAFASMTGNFQDGVVEGKIQFGSGWWFLDQKEGMEWQINALSSIGLLSKFVGMLTDSRSFMSYPRHEYFRRILCNLVGGDVERGELPDDPDLVQGLVADVCYHNAKRYFPFC